MAILKGIEVSVVIDGKALTEYDDEDTASQSPENPHEVSKYIEAISDAEFSIDITVPSSYDFMADAICFRLSLDGLRVRTFAYRNLGLQSEDGCRKIIAGSNVKNGKDWYLKTFKFNDINIVEVSTSTTGSNSVAKLGTITLDGFDSKIIGMDSKPKPQTLRLGQSPEFTEKELRGRDVTLQAGYGESRLSETPFYVKGKILNKKRPILSFEFKYRSKKALQSLRLIPRTPSPSPMPTPIPLEERPFDSLTPDEVQELARRLHAKCQAEREANIKLEKTKSECSVKREANIKPEAIKSERGARRGHDQEPEEMITFTARGVKTHPFEQGETIKLD